MTNKYIKKQLPVEAVLWNGDNFEEIKEFILSKKPDEIVCEPFEERMLCTDRFRSFYYNKGAVLFYDKKNKKDVFKYGDDCLNNYSCFGILPLGYYLYFGGNNRVFHSLKKEEFEAKYEQQDSNRTSKPSSFSLRNLVMQIAPKHIKYYIKRLEEYGFRLSAIYVSGIVEMTARDSRVSVAIHFVDKQCFRFDFYEDREYYYVDNNNWREAFNKLVASFPDEIMKNTNHYAALISR